jgi:hypothetical protein
MRVGDLALRRQTARSPAVVAFRAGAVGALPPEVLLGLDVTHEEIFLVREPEGVEGVAIGEEKVQTGVGAVLLYPVDGRLDAGERVRGLADVVVEEGEGPLGVGVAEDEA